VRYRWQHRRCFVEVAGRVLAEIDAIAAAAKSVRRDIIVLCHGGRIAMPREGLGTHHPAGYAPETDARRARLPVFLMASAPVR